MSDQEQGNGEGSTPEYAASKRKSPPVVTNDGSVRDELSAPEKLRIGGYMAPALRSGAKDGRTKRKVYVEGKDGSVRESTWGEVAQALSIKHGIAFEVAEKTPETTYACRVCAREFVWDRRGNPAAACDECRNPKCACGAALSRGAMNPSRIVRRHGKPPMCQNCLIKEKMATGRPDVFCACGVKLNPDAMKPSIVAKRAGKPPVCRACNAARNAATKKHPNVLCACGAKVGSWTMKPTFVAARKGRPPMCQSCSGRAGALARWGIQ